MEVVFNVLRLVWNTLFTVEFPLLGISFGSLFLGIFIVDFSLRILRPLLSIGVGSIRGVFSGKNSVSRSSKKESDR